MILDRVVQAVSHSKTGKVVDDVYIGDCRRSSFVVPDVAHEKTEPGFTLEMSKIRTASVREVIEHPHVRGASTEKSVDEMAADEPGTTSDEQARPPYGRHRDAPANGA